MKKKLVTFIFGLLSMLTLTSCVATVESKTNDGVYVSVDSEQDINVVFRYGTPYYYNGLIIYYSYNGWYYYPHYHNNRYYFRRCDRAIPNYIDRRYSPINPHHGTHINRFPNGSRRPSVAPNRIHHPKPQYNGNSHNRGTTAIPINRSSTKVTVRNGGGFRGRR